MMGFKPCKALDVSEFRATDTYLWLRDQLRNQKADAFNQLMVYALKSADADVAKAAIYYQLSSSNLEAIEKLKQNDSDK